MHASRKLFGLAVAFVAASFYFTGCDANGNLDQGALKAADGQALTAASCEPDDPACTPTGAHAKHSAYACTVCHAVAGRVVFAKPGPARAAGQPNPSFDVTAKTCSNVACHSVPAGTFSYFFPGGDGEPEMKTVSYGGGAAATTPSWYATGAGCAACHGNPPANYLWHGSHGGGNQCELCHKDALSSGGVATGLNPANAALHANGTVNVDASFRSSCFGCH
ncbi:MAG: CxxxxCH/CxxCH domain-containing protein [Anaeromyxobacter sp.]